MQPNKRRRAVTDRVRLLYFLLPLLLLHGCGLLPDEDDSLPAIELEISPAEVTLSPGETQIFTVTANHLNSESTFIWGATAGAIVANGATATFHAPLESGDYTVTVHANAEPSLNATATVSVVADDESGEDENADDGSNDDENSDDEGSGDEGSDDESSDDGSNGDEGNDDENSDTVEMSVLSATPDGSGTVRFQDDEMGLNLTLRLADMVTAAPISTAVVTLYYDSESASVVIADPTGRYMATAMTLDIAADPSGMSTQSGFSWNFTITLPTWEDIQEFGSSIATEVGRIWSAVVDYSPQLLRMVFRQEEVCVPLALGQAPDYLMGQATRVAEAGLSKFAVSSVDTHVDAIMATDATLMEVNAAMKAISVAEDSAYLLDVNSAIWNDVLVEAYKLS